MQAIPKLLTRQNAQVMGTQRQLHLSCRGVVPGRPAPPSPGREQLQRFVSAHEVEAALLMQGASSSATEALLARQDSCVHAGAGRLLQEVEEADGHPAAEAPLIQDSHALRACRRILLQLAMLKVPLRMLGLSRSGRPLR